MLRARDLQRVGPSRPDGAAATRPSTLVVFGMSDIEHGACHALEWASSTARSGAGDGPEGALAQPTQQQSRHARTESVPQNE